MNAQDIAKYFKIIRKWWWVIAFVFVSTLGTMLVLAFLSEPQYQATVTVQVSAPPPQEVPLYSQYGRAGLRDEIDQTQASLSEFLLEGDTAWRALDTVPDVQLSGEELQGRIKVDVPDSSQLMYIRVYAAQPEVAATLANAVVEVGLQQYGQLLARPTANTRQFIEQELGVARQKLKEAEAELTQFQIKNKIGNLDSAINSQYDLLRSLRIQGDIAWAEGSKPKAQGLEDIILERETDLQNMIGLSGEYNDLIDQVDRARTTYNFLLDRKAEAQIKESQILELGSIQVITPARPPKRPLAVISSQLIVLGSVASVLAGVLLAFLMEYLSTLTASHDIQPRAERTEMVALPDNSS